MQIQISWLLQKPTDLDLHCRQRQCISGLSRTRVETLKAQCKIVADDILNFFMPLPAEASSGAYSVPLWCDLLEVTTWVPFMLGSWTLVCYLPRPNLQLYARFAPGLCPGVGLGVKIYKCLQIKVKVNVQVYTHTYVHLSLVGHYLGTFYARKLKFGMLLTQILLLCARVAPGSFPWVERGARAFVYFWHVIFQRK